MPNLVFFLEEASAKELLRQLLPRMFPESDIQFIYKVYEGKNDLQQNILRDMREYARLPNSQFLILHDQDQTECTILKAKLQGLCSSWLDKTFIRIACRELESWYLAQLAAVDVAFGTNGLAEQQEKAKFRAPDSLTAPDAILEDLLKSKRKVYSKINGSRLLGKYIDPDCSRSKSFYHFIRAIRL